MHNLKSPAIAPQQDFSDCYEDIRLRFNRFAEDRGLSDQINAFLVAEMEAGHFNHSPYIAHLVVNGVDMGKNFAGSKYPVLDKLSLDIAHTGIDYYYDYQDHQAKAELEGQRRKISDGVIETFKLLGEPRSYIEAIALQKLLLNINPHYFDPYHYELYQQQREKLRLSIEHFSDQKFNQIFSSIIQENKNMAQQHDKYMHYMDEFKQTQNNALKILNRIDQSLPHKAQVESLIKQLQQQGIEVNDKLFTLLYQNEEIRNDLGKVLEYIENEKQEQLLQVQQQIKAANYQGLSDACHFVSELGRVTGSPELSAFAGIAQASVQIHRAVDQIMTASLSGFAIMGPYAAIGMAVLGVFSLFRRSPDPNRAIMKQLVNLSNQITALHKDISQRFQHLDEKLNYIFQKMIEGFESLKLNTTISVSRKIAEIQSQLETLTRISKIAFEEMLLKDLKSHVAYISDIREGISDPPSSQTVYEDRLRGLREFISEKSCSPLLNGTVYSHLLEHNSAHTTQFIELFKQRDVANLQNLVGLLLYFAKYDLKITELQSFNEKQIFHPRLWQIALEAYLEFKKFNSDKYQYDPKGMNLQKFSDQLHHFFGFIYQIQNNKSLYQKLIAEIILCQTQLQNELSTVVKANGGTLITTRPIDYEVPNKLRDHKDSVNVTKVFFTRDRTEILKKAGISIPPKFLEAEKLGLGYIEIRMHMPANLHKKHHKHHGKYRCNARDTAGLEINFYLAGQKLSLYKAGITPKCKFTKLEEMYTHLITTCKTQTSEADRSNQIITQAIQQHNASSKTQSAQRIASYLTDNLSYHRLLKLNHLLLAYLSCAGLTTEQIKPLSDQLLLVDLINIFERYAKNTDNRNMPTIQFCSTEILLQEYENILSKLTEFGSSLQLSPQILCLQQLLLQLPKINTSLPSSQIYCSFFPQALNPTSKSAAVSNPIVSSQIKLV